MNTERETEYFNYVTNHIENVQRVWAEIRQHPKLEPFLSVKDTCLLDKLILAHDQSKFSADEFYGYAQYFYPEPGKEKRQREFSIAWNHHQKSNRHHWDYWVMSDLVVLEMPRVYLLEMLCDWAAMSLQFGDTPSDFYKKRGQFMQIHDKTKEYLWDWMPIFDLAVEAITKENMEVPHG